MCPPPSGEQNRVVAFCLELLVDWFFSERLQQQMEPKLTFCFNIYAYMDGAYVIVAKPRHQVSVHDRVLHLAVLYENSVSNNVIVGCRKRNHGCHNDGGSSKNKSKAQCQEFSSLPMKNIVQEAARFFQQLRENASERLDTLKQCGDTMTSSMVHDSLMADFTYGMTDYNNDLLDSAINFGPGGMSCCGLVRIVNGVNVCTNEDEKHRVLRVTRARQDQLPTCSGCGTNSAMKVYFLFQVRFSSSNLKT